MPDDDFYKQTTLPGADQPSPQSPQRLPISIGPYTVEAHLGKQVYLASDPDTGDTLAVKTLATPNDQQLVDQFLKEAEIIALADHSNIVKLRGQGEWEGGLYIAMEYIQGRSLRTLLTRQPMSLERALETVQQIAHAILHLHTHGVIHRDLKPENILITDEGQVKVIDFGIAELEATAVPRGRERFLGTPVYMSPEQIRDPSAVSYPSDIYALGIITYEMVMGRLSGGKIHLSMVPKGLQPILSKALQEDPTNRYGDIVDFIHDLTAYLSSERIQREKGGRDELSELSEHLQNAQLSLLPKEVPSWKKMELGVINHRGTSISGVYYDFFELPEGAYGILLSEPSAKGGEGALFSATLRGMVRALAHFTSKPAELVTILNELLVDDPIDQIFTLSYLILNPAENRLRFISCGYGKLWHVPTGTEQPREISANNIALGIDRDAHFLEVSQQWNVGDTLLLNTFATIHGEEGRGLLNEEGLKQTLVQNLYKPPQKQVEAIFRKAMAASTASLEERSITVLSVQRIE